MQFELGDRVSYTSKTRNEGPRNNDLGVVLFTKEEGIYTYLVKFDKMLSGRENIYIPEKFGEVSEFCWWCQEEQLKKITGGKREMTEDTQDRALFEVYAIDSRKEEPEIIIRKEVFASTEEEARTEVIAEIMPFLKERKLKPKKVDFIINLKGKVPAYELVEEVKKLAEGLGLCLIKRKR